MRHTNQSIMGIILSLVAIIGLIGMTWIYLNTGQQQVTIRFIPDHLNTVPGDTGWFIVAIDGTQQMEDPEVQIQTNVSIATEYTYWSQTPLLEVFLYPDVTHVDICVKINVTLQWGSVAAHASAFMYVWNWTNSELSMAVEKRDAFVEYLALNHPEFGINATTVWTPIYNAAGILVVCHYLFRSGMWEMEVAWHVMIPPYDWVQVYLRQRNEVSPCWAAQIESWSATERVISETTPPEEIYRAR